MNRYLSIHYPMLYQIVANIRMSFYMFTNQMQKAQSIITEEFYFVPAVEHYIKLTWLPNPINNPQSKSCFIGQVGLVTKVYPDGSFDLKIESGAKLFVHNKYKFEYFTNLMRTENSF